MNIPAWVVSIQKYIRARDAVKTGVEADIKAEYIKIGGKVSGETFTAPVEEVPETPETTEEIVEAPKKTKVSKKK